MFEAAELDRTIPKEEYKARIPVLRSELLDVQQELIRARFPVIIVFAGVDGAGKGETVNLLNEWMDPRWIETRAYAQPSDEETERPEYWRYWRDLPRHGRIALFLSSWYSRPVLDRVYGRSDRADFDEQLERIAGFERTLTDDGALILKFWMHLSKAAQKTRLRTLEKDPLTRWRMSHLQWEHWRLYDRFVATAERALQRTSTVVAPWTIVEGVDEAYRSLTLATSIRDAIRKALADGRGTTGRAPAARASSVERRKARGGRRDRRQPKQRRQASVRCPGDDPQHARHVAEGLQESVRHRARASSGPVEPAAAQGAGKRHLDDPRVRRLGCGGQGRRHQTIDRRRSMPGRTRSFRSPRRPTKSGRTTTCGASGVICRAPDGSRIFDRSWYGRVLVERVEGFADRTGMEARLFRDQRVRGTARRARHRPREVLDPHYARTSSCAASRSARRLRYKKWKLTDEDWRNRAKWADYERAVNDMVERTSTRLAPWTLVEGNDKNFARLKVLKTTCRNLKREIAK